MSYYTAYICKNGHCISSYGSNTPNEKYCSKCGSEVISACPACQKAIRGSYKSPYGLPAEYEIPAYCLYCGQPFPWTEAALDAAEALIQEDECLDQLTQQQLIGSLPDIISETPKTKISAVRLKKALASAGRFTAEGIRQFVIDFGCELAKQQLGL